MGVASVADPYPFDTDPEPGKKGFSTRKILKIINNRLNYCKNKLLLFSMVFVDSGSVSFETDQASGSATLRVANAYNF